MIDDYTKEDSGFSIIGQGVLSFPSLYTNLSVDPNSPRRKKTYQAGFFSEGEKREVTIPVISILDYNGIDTESSKRFMHQGSTSSVSCEIDDSVGYVCREGDIIDPKRITTMMLGRKLFDRATYPLKHGYEITVRGGRIEEGRMYTRKLKGNETPADLDAIYVHVRIIRTGDNGSKEPWGREDPEKHQKN
ncbi:MAG: hypothetical protein JW716_04060 [Candidatus Aenigmarchaeota archaeon]|nr:hypothetical protein [Candidatus Aenigmarchaeota archaeon]